MQDTGRGPENEGENAENFQPKEKRGVTDLCPAGAVASLRDSPAARAPFARRARKP
jgi:hypothetical protein